LSKKVYSHSSLMQAKWLDLLRRDRL